MASFEFASQSDRSGTHLIAIPLRRELDENMQTLAASGLDPAGYTQFGEERSDLVRSPPDVIEGDLAVRVQIDA